MNGEEWLEVVESTVRELGQMSFAHIAAEFSHYEELAKCLNKGRALFVAGPIPFEGGRWEHMNAWYGFSLDELKKATSAERIVDLVSKRRREALIASVCGMNALFMQKTGALAGPAQAILVGDEERVVAYWRAVILRGEFLQQTVELVGDAVRVAVDTTVAFEPVLAGVVKDG